MYGADGLLDRMPGAKGPHPNRVAPPIEKAILAHALKHPTHGAQRVADELMMKGIQVSSGGVRGVWIRNKLQTRHHRLLRLEETVRDPEIRRFCRKLDQSFPYWFYVLPSDSSISVSLSVMACCLCSVTKHGPGLISLGPDFAAFLTSHFAALNELVDRYSLDVREKGENQSSSRSLLP